MLSAGYSLIRALDLAAHNAHIKEALDLPQVANKPPREIFQSAVGKIIYIWSLVNSPEFSHVGSRFRVGRLTGLSDAEISSLTQAISTTHNYLSRYNSRSLSTTLRYWQMLNLGKESGLNANAVKKNNDFSITFETPTRARSFGARIISVREIVQEAPTYRISDTTHALWGRELKKIHPYNMDAPLSFILKYRGTPVALMSSILLDPKTLCIVQMQGIRAEIWDANGTFIQHGSVHGIAKLDWEQALYNHAAILAKDHKCRHIAIQSSTNIPLKDRDAVTGQTLNPQLIWKRLDGLAKRNQMTYDPAARIFTKTIT